LLFSNFIQDFTERATVEVDLIIQYQHRIIPVEVKVAEKI
jgi:Holliday junction resolvase-like predicted endonuclease